MIVELYAVEYASQLPLIHFNRLLEPLPSDMQEKIKRYRRWEDAHAGLLGKHLLLMALQDGGYPADLSAIQYTPYDRPYLPEGPPFNISHSGNRVICALSPDGRIGADLEAIHPLTITDFDRQFTPGEWESMNSSDDPLAAFYHFWTAKESVIKADGRGLNLPLQQMEADDQQIMRIDGQPWHLRKINAFDGYICHIATERPVSTVELHELKMEEIRSRYS